MAARDVYAASPLKRRRRTRAEMEHLRAGLFEIVASDYPTTARSVFYRAVAGGLVGKTEQEYQNAVCRLLLLMRRAGELPHAWIADHTRWMRKPRTYGSLAAALHDTARHYRRALWQEMPAYVEIWCEKDTIAGVLLEETDPYDVPLMVARGFASESYLYESARDIAARGKPAYVYYLGDHDPSGLLISRAIERGLRRLAPRTPIQFERVAVTPEQIAAWQLPTRPTKESSHSRGGFAGASVDIDAIASARLRGLVRDCIERHLDAERLAALRVAEDSEREHLGRIAAAVGEDWGDDGPHAA